METCHVCFHFGTKLRIQELKVVPALFTSSQNIFLCTIIVPVVLNPPPEGLSASSAWKDLCSAFPASYMKPVCVPPVPTRELLSAHHHHHHHFFLWG